MLEVTQMTDFMDAARNRPFTKAAWVAFVEDMQEAKMNRKPTYGDALARAEEMMRIQGQIPREVIL